MVDEAPAVAVEHRTEKPPPAGRWHGPAISINRHGDGNAHGNTNLPNVILGGTGGYFKMGRFLQLRSTNPTKVLNSPANSMGVEVPTFGKDAWVDTLPLTGLTG
jgi:hypothetical protein